MGLEAQDAENLNELFIPKYARLGWFDQDRPIDKICLKAVSILDGNTLPQRWRWKTPEEHTKQFGNITWAKTKSYHLLFINGNHVLRIWTDTPKCAIVDLNVVAVHAAITCNFSVDDIPKSCTRKCKPLTKRVRLSTENEIVSLLNEVKKLYGLEVR
jgi:hypothetical protein